MRGDLVGRPPKSPEFRRSERVQIRFTQDERAQIERAAGAEVMSEWARDVLLREARKLLKK